MKKMTFVFLMVLLVFGILIMGCPTDGQNNPSRKIPGKFSVTKLSDTMGDSSARGVSLGTYTITNSESIFFILRNVGDFPITDITLTPGKLNKNGSIFEPITGNGITANPSAITVLETSGNTVVESVIKVNINHGDIIGLIAQQYIQKADFAGTTLRITGKTTDENGAVLDVSIDLDIETLIKVASFDVMYSLDNGVTFEKAEYVVNGFYYPLLDGQNTGYIVIKNTGNVNIRYKDSYTGLFNNSVPWIIIQPNEYSQRLYSIDSRYFIQIDTMGIVFNNQGNDDLTLKVGTSLVSYHPSADWFAIFNY